MDRDACLKAFLSKETEWLFHWRSPIEAKEKLAEIISALRSDFSEYKGAFVQHRSAQGLREMWVLAKCATLIGSQRVRLNPSDPPDGFFQADEIEIGAEVTEVIEPGRRRGLEYKPDAPEIWHDPVERWVERADGIPGALAEAIRRKMSKPYPPGTRLLIYLNIGEWGIRHTSIEAEIKQQLSRETGPFEAIYVLWKTTLFSSTGELWRSPDAEVIADIDDEELWESATRP